jgi:hypothetical protein
MSFSPKAVTAMAVIIWDAVDAVTIMAGAEVEAITMAGGEDADGTGIDPRRFQRPPLAASAYVMFIMLLKLLLCPLAASCCDAITVSPDI